MLFRQLFDSESSTYTYLLADAGQAVLIDPVKNKLDDYLRLLRELDLQLVLALDTHTHADHITALGELRTATGCRSGFGQQSGSACASFTFADGQRLAFGERELVAWHTPGHTDDSISLYHADSATLMSGDEVLTHDGRAWFNPEWVDRRAHSATEERLRALDVRYLLPGHGRPVEGDVWGRARSAGECPPGRGILTRCARRFGRWG